MNKRFMVNNIPIENLRNDVISQFNFSLKSIYTDWVVQQRELIRISNAIQQSTFNVMRLQNDR